MAETAKSTSVSTTASSGGAASGAKDEKTTTRLPADAPRAAESASGDVHLLLGRKEIAMQNGDQDEVDRIDAELRDLGVRP